MKISSSQFFFVAYLTFLTQNCYSTKKMLDKIRCKKDKHGNEECSCPEDPITELYVDTTDKTCDYYYLCHLGRAMKRKCGQGFAFHPTLKECISRKRIPSNICRPLVTCPFRPDRYIEDKEDCTKYYLCLHGSHTHWICPENTYFEPREEKCENDKAQTDACKKVAQQNHMNRIGFNKDPPKTSIALDQAKAYMKKNH